MHWSGLISIMDLQRFFVRVNSFEVKLCSADLAMAQISARWRGFRRQFEVFREELEDECWSLDTGFLLRPEVIAAAGQCRFKTAGTIPIEDLKEAWERAKDGLLSSPLLLLTVMAYALQQKQRLTEIEQQGLIHWAYFAIMKAWYSNSSESALDEDLALLAKGGSPSDLTERIRQQTGRLDVRAVDFAGRGQRKALFPTAFLALRNQGAKDWHSDVGMSLVLSDRNHRVE
jgi:hypothetical protein